MIPKGIIQDFVLKLQLEQVDCVQQILSRAELRTELSGVPTPPINELMEEENKFFELYEPEDIENHMIDLYRHKTLSWVIKDLRTFLNRNYGSERNNQSVSD